MGAECESAPEDVPANLSEINKAPRRSAPKPHADLHACEIRVRDRRPAGARRGVQRGSTRSAQVPDRRKAVTPEMIPALCIGARR
jgi:hypothetical protein